MKLNPVAIVEGRAAFQLGDAMRIVAAGLKVQAQVGFDAEKEILAQGVLNDALRYLVTGTVSGLNYTARLFESEFVPKERSRQ